MQVQPYLNFGGRCEESLSFYHTALGAEVEMLMRFRESPDSASSSTPRGGNPSSSPRTTVPSRS